jgi:hypothetical protein
LKSATSPFDPTGKLDALKKVAGAGTFEADRFVAACVLGDDRMQLQMKVAERERGGFMARGVDQLDNTVFDRGL